MNKNEFVKELRSYIGEKLFANQTPSDFTDDTPLISSRLLDSIVILGMIAHLEEKFNIEFEAHELNVDNLDTINKTADFLSQKLSK